MLTLPWLIIYAILFVVLVMHVLSWTPIPEMITRKFLIFVHNDERESLNGEVAGYWMHTYPYNDSNPKATVKHEMVHIYQNWRYSWMVIALLRMVSKKMVFRLEAKAYAAGVNAGRDIDEAAYYLVKGYDLKVSKEQARRKIESFM